MVSAVCCRDSFSDCSVSFVKAWCLTVWRILEYTFCIIAYTLISLAGIHSSGIRVTWFWFSASKKHPSGVVCLTGAHIVQSAENNRYLADFIQPSLYYDLHKQTTQKQPKRFQLLHSFCNLFCLFIIAANIVQFSFHQIQRLNYTICKSQSQGFS